MMGAVYLLDVWCAEKTIMLSANDKTRMHWAVYAKHVRIWRAETNRAASGRVMRVDGGIRRYDALRRGMTRARIDAEIHFADAKIRDEANYHATVKPIVDELAAWGMLPDDDKRYVEGPFVTIGTPLRAGRLGRAGVVMLTITDLS